jgi:hypothetical protein
MTRDHDSRLNACRTGTLLSTSAREERYNFRTRNTKKHVSLIFPFSHICGGPITHVTLFHRLPAIWRSRRENDWYNNESYQDDCRDGDTPRECHYNTSKSHIGHRLLYSRSESSHLRKRGYVRNLT